MPLTRIIGGMDEPREAGGKMLGAGDVFVGALAARLADGAALTEALGYANAAAFHVGTLEADRDALGPGDVWRLLSGSAA